MGAAIPAAGSKLASVLPDYEILGELGRGAMGVVLSAQHRSLGRLVAVKELPPAFAADERVRKRFLREAQTVAALSHPHVVAIYDFVDRDGHLALIMEQLDGGTVWDRFTTQGVTAPAACAMLLSAAAGLDHAHRHGVLHRDVKPSNLLFAADGQLKVTDFGMAKVVGGERTLATADGLVLGTPAYMAPEQAEGRAVGPQADVYACGAMLYELLSGQLPFAAPSAVAMLIARVRHDAPSLAGRAPHVPAPVAEVTHNALARSEAERYLTVEDFAVALGQAAVRAWGEDWLGATGVTVTGSEAIERASRRLLRPGWRPGSVLEPEPGSRSGPSPEAGSAGREPAISLSSPAVSPILIGDTYRPAPVDLHTVSPVDVVDISEVRQPPSPLRPWLVATVLVVAFAALAAVAPRDQVRPAPLPGAGLSINGVPTGTGAPVEVDLDQPVTVTGLGSGTGVTLAATAFHLPLGRVLAPLEDGQAQIDPAYLRWTTGGAFDLAVSVDDGPVVARLAARPLHPWWQSAPVAGLVVVMLFGISSVLSNVRGLWHPRRRLGPLVGIVLSGHLVGLAAFLLAALGRGLLPDLWWLAAGGAVMAAAAVAYGEGSRRRRRRQRLSRATIVIH